MSKRVVLTVSGVIAADIREQIASGKRPRADYLELARGFNADLLDYAAARIIAGRAGAVLEKLVGPNLVLAYACFIFLKRRQPPSSNLVPYTTPPRWRGASSARWSAA